MTRALASLLFVLAMLAPWRAMADVQACVDASEKGQRARASGKLREAQKQFQVCSDAACPSLVRRDCAQWQGEVAPYVPSVVLGAKDRTGRDLFEVMVLVDGEVIARSLDGKSVPVDPGPHTFQFETPKHPPVLERVLVKEGEKARAINVVIGTEKVAPAAAAATPARAAPAEIPAPAPTAEGGHTLPPWLLVGAGGAAVVVGLVVVVTAPALPEGCDANTQTCTRNADESSASYRDRQDRAGEHDARPVLGGVIATVGGAAIGGGLLWHFLEPTGPRARAAVTPWTTGTSAGVSLGGAF
ncbi:MAG: hypothetical protein JWP97_2613 [Labilithrix sp.]|nr:hypothetical protein [Labilithrix sp.]